jgi:ribosomal protein L11 methyltransferase
MDPGMAFGTGTHPTTRLCLEMIEALFDEGRRTKDEGEIRSSFVFRPSSVIDIGCGSGILSVAALKLGVSHALGVDIDPLAVDVSRENAALNGVPVHFEVGLGSVDEIRQGKFSLQTAPVVLANILAPVIVRLLDGGLGELLEPGGALILSGIIADQAPDVEAALRRHRLQVIEHRQEGDWVALRAS